jgi:hypothetical protein
MSGYDPSNQQQQKTGDSQEKKTDFSNLLWVNIPLYPVAQTTKKSTASLILAMAWNNCDWYKNENLPIIESLKTRQLLFQYHPLNGALGKHLIQSLAKHFQDDPSNTVHDEKIVKTLPSYRKEFIATCAQEQASQNETIKKHSLIHQIRHSIKVKLVEKISQPEDGFYYALFLNDIDVQKHSLCYERSRQRGSKYFYPLRSEIQNQGSPRV